MHPYFTRAVLSSLAIEEVISMLKGFKLCARKCTYRGTVKSAVDSFGPDD